MGSVVRTVQDGPDPLKELDKIQIIPKTKTGRYRRVYSFDGDIYGSRYEDKVSAAGEPYILVVLERIGKKSSATNPTVLAHATIRQGKMPDELRHLGENLKTAEVMTYIGSPDSREVVPEEKKGKGIGKALKAEVEEIATAREIGLLYAVVGERNKAARGSIEASGYIMHPEPYAVDEWVDLLYYKRIGAAETSGAKASAAGDTIKVGGKLHALRQALRTAGGRQLSEISEDLLPQEVLQLRGIKQNPVHGGLDALQHTRNMLHELDTEGVKYPELVKAASLLHDIGKFQGALGEENYFGHPKRGAEMADAPLRKMGYDPWEVDLIKHLIRIHDLLGRYAQRDDDDRPLLTPVDAAKELSPPQSCKDKVTAREVLDMHYRMNKADIRSIPELARFEPDIDKGYDILKQWVKH
jgi:GNAT superfamily N-acetyltransferase